MIVKKSLIFAMLFLCFGCTQGEKKQKNLQELRLNIHSEPPTLDPRKAYDSVSCSVLRLCFEGLTKLDEKGEPQLCLAEKVENTETTYTFHLREAKWSDGTAVTAEDFERTWKTLLEPSFPCSFANVLYVIKNAQAAKNGALSVEDVGVKATNERTLVVELEHPAPYFLHLVASGSFSPTPRHVELSEKQFVCNGPFKMVSHLPYQEITLEKNQLYWDAQAVVLQKIHLIVVEDESTELSMYENDELDWAGNPFSVLPTDALSTLKQKHLMTTLPFAASYYYIFNTRVPPFDNVNIRRAFALAIQRQELIENVLQNGQTAASGLVPPLIGGNPKGYFKDGDLEEARRCLQKGLDELGIKAQELPPITLSYNTLEMHHKIAQAIQEQWLTALGVKVTLANREWKVFLDEVNKRQFQVARMAMIASYPDPKALLDLYKYPENSNNHSSWSNPHFTELLNKADHTSDSKRRNTLLREAEEILLQEMPIAPIYYYTQSFLKKPYVKGTFVTAMGDLDLKTAYVERDVQ